VTVAGLVTTSPRRSPPHFGGVRLLTTHFPFARFQQDVGTSPPFTHPEWWAAGIVFKQPAMRSGLGDALPSMPTPIRNTRRKRRYSQVTALTTVPEGPDQRTTPGLGAVRSANPSMLRLDSDLNTRMPRRERKG